MSEIPFFGTAKNSISLNRLKPITKMAAHQLLLMSCHLYSVNSLPIVLLLYTHTCPVTEFAVASHLNTANSCCHHVFLRHFRFQKCLPVYSNIVLSAPCLYGIYKHTANTHITSALSPSYNGYVRPSDRQ